MDVERWRQRSQQTRSGGSAAALSTPGDDSTFNIVVLGRDSVGATGLGARSLNVVRDPPRVGCKCSAVDAGLMWVALRVVARRRRRG